MGGAPAAKKKERGAFNELGILIVLAALCVVIGLFNNVFFTPNNAINVLRQISVMAIIAVGQAFVIITGGIDLSVGSFISIGGVSCAAMIAAGVGPWPALVLALGVGVGFGLVSGVIIVKLGIAPFITTLAMLNIVKGVSYLISGGLPINFENDVDFLGGTAGPIPVPVILMFIVIIAGHIVLTRTEFGRNVFAVGGNEKAAKLSGIRVGRIKLSVYAIVGGLAAFTGVITAANLNSADTAAGAGMELDVIAATVIGGCSLSGGQGSVIGVLIGAGILGVIRNGFVLLMVSAYWQMITIGIVIVAACAFDMIRRSRQ
jgi:ribose/xylose/arabinose/galactoside ABC-type transport system permease subunit